jgi:acyl-CoA thioesterase-1
MSAALQVFQSEKIARRALLGGMLGFALTAEAPPRAPTVVMLGDSITAGYGLPAAQALPAQLQAALVRLGRPAKVISAGVSGDTTADGLARIDFSVPAGTDLCIIELGGNDLLQGIDPKVTADNLDRIVARLQARGVPVLLTGIAAPPAIGSDYARDFDAAFAAVARKRGVAFYADLRRGAATPALTQADGIHPNAQGVRIIAAALAPAVDKALRQGAGRRR